MFVTVTVQLYEFVIDCVCVFSCAEVQRWDAWWQNMRIVRGRTRGLNGSNFYGCLILICVRLATVSVA